METRRGAHARPNKRRQPRRSRGPLGLDLGPHPVADASSGGPRPRRAGPPPCRRRRWPARPGSAGSTSEPWVQATVGQPALVLRAVVRAAPRRVGREVEVALAHGVAVGVRPALEVLALLAHRHRRQAYGAELTDVSRLAEPDGQSTAIARRGRLAGDSGLLRSDGRQARTIDRGDDDDDGADQRRQREAVDEGLAWPSSAAASRRSAGITPCSIEAAHAADAALGDLADLRRQLRPRHPRRPTCTGW